MPSYICVTCGTQYPPSDAPPEGCAICLEDRQDVKRAGQQWTTLAERQGQHQTVIEQIGEGLWTVGTTPKLGIGQHAHLLHTPSCNVLWDCVAFIDDATVEALNAL